MCTARSEEFTDLFPPLLIYPFDFQTLWIGLGTDNKFKLRTIIKADRCVATGEWNV